MNAIAILQHCYTLREQKRQTTVNSTKSLLSHVQTKQFKHALLQLSTALKTNTKQ